MTPKGCSSKLISMAAETGLAAKHSRKSITEITTPFRSKSALRAVAILSADTLLYVACLFLTLWLSNYLLRAAASILLGIAITRLFIVGHDCCHGSFFPSSKWNKFFGRIVFLPSLTAYSLWEIGHNVLHHSFPNLKGRDYIWTPKSKQEYDAMSHSRQWAERFYRSSSFGLGAYYLIELWWNKLMFPNRSHVGARRKVHVYDGLLVTAFALLFVSTVIASAQIRGASIVAPLCFSVLIPFGVWNYLMGFAIYVHHTHPTVAWFDKKEIWNRALPQIRNTVHLTFPLPFSAMLHNIMEHNAHHSDINVPLYELPAAQRQLEEQIGESVVVQAFSFRAFHESLRVCKLYDFENYCWLDFKGNVTAQTIPFAGE